VTNRAHRTLENGRQALAALAIAVEKMKCHPLRGFRAYAG
jgi:hypothetical protein